MKTAAELEREGKKIAERGDFVFIALPCYIPLCVATQMPFIKAKKIPLKAP